MMIARRSLLVAVALGAVVTGCGDRPRAAAPPPPPIVAWPATNEVLEAQEQLYPAQTTLAQIRRNRLTAYVQLYKGARWRLESDRCGVD